MDVVLESTEGRLQELFRLLVASLEVAFVDSRNPSQDAWARTVIEPFEQSLELFVSVLAAARLDRPLLDLFVDQGEKERVVPVEERNEGRKREREFGRDSRSRVRERQ